MREVMIDTETMGVTPGSAIVSIGAVKFNRTKIESSFRVNVSLQSCLMAGLTIDSGTVGWWKKQKDEAKASMSGDAQPLAAALRMLHDFIMRTEQGKPEVNLPIWCKGGSFDFPLLAAAYRAEKQPLPWNFWQERDCRTLFKLCGDIYGFELPEAPGIAHSALDDATHQAQQVMKCLRLMKRGR
jgi:hypothetical protein